MEETTKDQELRGWWKTPLQDIWSGPDIVQTISKEVLKDGIDMCGYELKTN